MHFVQVILSYVLLLLQLIIQGHQPHVSIRDVLQFLAKGVIFFFNALNPAQNFLDFDNVFQFSFYPLEFFHKQLLGWRRQIENSIYVWIPVCTLSAKVANQFYKFIEVRERVFVRKPHPFTMFLVQESLDLFKIGVLLDTDLVKMCRADMEKNLFKYVGLRDLLEGNKRKGLSLV